MTDDSTRLPGWFGTWPLLGPHDSPPPTVRVDVTVGAQSRRGNRAVNDDHYVVVRHGRDQETILTSLPDDALPTRFEESGYALVVADGMGAAGELASRMAISTLMHLALYFGRWNIRVDEPIAEEVMDRADRFYRSIDSTLVQASRGRTDGLETTLTAAFSAGNDLFFVHVGRSRAYMFRDQQLMQLTRDHNGSGEDSGRGMVVNMFTRDKAGRPALTPALGRPGASRIDVERCSLLDGDLVLLCTDGLTDVVDDGKIAQTLLSHITPDDQCRALVDLAASCGTSDDVTVLVAQFHIFDQPALTTRPR